MGQGSEEVWHLSGGDSGLRTVCWRGGAEVEQGGGSSPHSVWHEACGVVSSESNRAGIWRV